MQATLNFLKKLKSNNNKEWFDKNKTTFLEAKEEVEGLIDSVITGIRKFDKKIDSNLTAKECTFRIYKDVRFSKDKTPYKTNMGASINPGGRKSPFAGYYVHIEPGGSFVAGGVWMPEPPMLQAIRQEIDYNPEPLLKIMKSAGFKKFFKGLDEDDKLKTVPKGFAKDHPNIELLKNKNFVVSHYLSDKDIASPKAASKIVDACKAMHPFIEYLRHASE